jgi:hypothetical protein
LTLVSTKFPSEAMPLSSDSVSCIPKHIRSVRFEAYACAGLTHGLREAKTGTDWRRLTLINAAHSHLPDHHITIQPGIEK